MLEKRVAALEGGTAAVACASGQSAVFQAILCLAHAGDNVVASTNLYGGSYSLFKTLLPRMGISARWVRGDDAEAYRPLIDERTKLVFVETVGNPRVSVPDLRNIADIAHEYHVPFVVSGRPDLSSHQSPPFSSAANQSLPSDRILMPSLPRSTTRSGRAATGAP